MASGDVYKVTCVFSNSISTKDLSFGFHIEQNALTMASVEDIGGAVEDWWSTGSGGGGQKSRHANEIALQRVELRRIFPLEATVQAFTTGLPIAGSETGDPLPANSAVIISLRCDQIGRRRRNRLYLPPYAEADSEGNISEATAQATWTDWDGLNSDLTALTSSVPMTVWSPTDEVSNLVTAHLVDRRPRSQRRRTVRAASYISAGA